jgi:hypothetical protein
MKMTKTYEFLKEDMCPEELDDHIYRMEREQELLNSLLHEEKSIKFARIILGKPRYRNRKAIKYAKIRGEHETNSLPF